MASDNNSEQAVAAINDRVTVECVDCGTTAELPPVPNRPGFVGIEPITGWTAPPPRCPACSGSKGPVHNG